MPFNSIRLAACQQMSTLLSGLGGGGGERDWSAGGGSSGGGPAGSSSSGELADIRIVLETATAALEEIRNQVRRYLCFSPPSVSVPGPLQDVCSFSYLALSLNTYLVERYLCLYSYMVSVPRAWTAGGWYLCLCELHVLFCREHPSAFLLFSLASRVNFLLFWALLSSHTYGR